jgi:YadA-like C-terminal region.
MDQRQRSTDRRISQIGALATAMSQMSVHSLPTQPGRGRLAVGVGSQDGEQACPLVMASGSAGRPSPSVAPSVAARRMSVPVSVSTCKPAAAACMPEPAAQALASWPA